MAADPEEVERLHLQLQMQEIKLEALQGRMAAAHRVLTVWRQGDLNDYETLVAVGNILSGCPWPDTSIVARRCGK